MEVPRMRIAELDGPQLSEVRELEKELDVCLVALEPKYRLADLAEEQIRQIQSKEAELGVVLLAYRCD